MLARIHGEELERIALLQIRQHAVNSATSPRHRPRWSLAARAFVPSFDIDLHEAIELDLLTGGAKHRFFHGDLERGLIEHRRHHLTGDEAVPDQRIKLEHIAPQITPHPVRRVFHRSRTNRLVRVLRAFLRAIGVRLTGNIVLAVFAFDEMAHGVERIVGDARRIGSHVGDQADGTFVAHLDSFVKLLRQLHRAPRLKPQLARRLLLQLAGDKWRGRIAAPFFFFDLADNPGSPV